MFFTQHIYANDMRIASKVNADSFANPETLWYHSDQSPEHALVPDGRLFDSNTLAEPLAGKLKDNLTENAGTPDKTADVIKTLVEGFLKSNGTPGPARGRQDPVGPGANPSMPAPIDRPLPSFPEYIKLPEVKF